MDLEVFEARNRELQAAGAGSAEGTRENPPYLPAPHRVAKALVTAFTTAPERQGDEWFHRNLLHSCLLVLWGFALAATVGVPLGLACGYFRALSRLTEPFVDFVRYMPAPVFGPLAVAVLGLGDEPKVSIIFIGTFFPMVLIVSNTTRHLDRILLEAARTLGAKPHQLLLRVALPNCLPRLYRDLRLLLGSAWTYLVVAELIGEKSGISVFLYQQQRYRAYDNVYAAIIIIGLLGFLTDQALEQLGSLLFPWESGDDRLRRWQRRLGQSLRPKEQRPEPQAITAERGS